MTTLTKVTFERGFMLVLMVLATIDSAATFLLRHNPTLSDKRFALNILLIAPASVMTLFRLKPPRILEWAAYLGAAFMLARFVYWVAGVWSGNVG